MSAASSRTAVKIGGQQQDSSGTLMQLDVSWMKNTSPRSCKVVMANTRISIHTRFHRSIYMCVNIWLQRYTEK